MGGCSYIDRRGEKAIRLADLEPFERSRTEFEPAERDGLWGFKWEDAWVLSCKWKKVKHFSWSYCPVCRNGKWGMINISGELIIPYTWEDIEIVGSDIWAKHGGSYGMIDAKGNQLTEFEWLTIEKRWDGYTAVWQDRYECGLVGADGSLTIEPQWANIDSFDSVLKGLAVVSSVSTFGMDVTGCELGMIDRSGTLVVPDIYDEIERAEDDHAYVRKNRAYGLLNKEGKQVIECCWEYIFFLGEGLWRVEIDEKQGLFDGEGRQILACEWDYIKITEEGFIAAVLDGQQYYFNLTGEAVEK